MDGSFSRFLLDESGATAIEYGLIVALIGVAIIGSVSALGGQISDMFGIIGDKVMEVTDNSLG